MKANFYKATLSALMSLVIPVMPINVLADEAESGREFSIKDFSFRIGSYDISSKTSIRLDGADGKTGTEINFESDLNVDDQASTAYLSLSWRMSGRHYLEMEHFNLKRVGLQTLTTDIEFGDEIYNIGATVESFFKIKVTRASYSFIVRESEKARFGVSAGLHRTSVSSGISEITSSFAVENVELAGMTAPLPVIGVSGGWRLGDKWSAFARVQIFRFKVSDYKGLLDHASVKLEYDVSEHLGIGIGYDYFKLDLDIDKKTWNGNVRFQIKGPIVYLKGRF